MNDDILCPTPSARRQPLYGITVLVVDDSDLAAEAIRLMCLRSGARSRRADCLRSAQRHLQTYHPHVAIVDMGLPDGNGADLIHMIGATKDAPPVIGLSGDPAMADEAFAAGARDFIAKPLHNLATFQRTILGVLPYPPSPDTTRHKDTVDRFAHARGLVAASMETVPNF